LDADTNLRKLPLWISQFHMQFHAVQYWVSCFIVGILSSGSG